MKFGQRAADFWSATPIEFWALYEATFGKSENPAMTRSELKQFMEKYPDVR